MQRQLTTPYSTPQNGIIKSRNQMVVQAAHQMLKAKDLSGTFWGGGSVHDGHVHPKLVDIQGSRWEDIV
jgi:hypothetical protein